MEFLPRDITFDIFSRLPAESVLLCRQVCKTWRNIIHDSQFADAHLHRQLLNHNGETCGGVAAKVCLFFLVWLNKRGVSYQPYYGEYDESININQFSYATLTRINHPLIPKRHQREAIIGSCNGLVCLSVIHPECKWHIYDPTYICNPITREYACLPKFNFDNQMDRLMGKMMSGFGYHPSTKEYKVVRIFYSSTKSSVGHVEVYTVGSGSGWRSRGEIVCSLGYEGYGLQPGVLVCGVLHWLDNERKTVVGFDLEDEVFHVTPLPSCFCPGYCYKTCLNLKVFNGCLYLVHEELGERVDIWSFNKTWNRELSIPWEGTEDDKYDPFALTKRGEVLLWYNFTHLCRYDPRTRNLNKLDTGLVMFEAVSHINSFVSLKALGEKSRKRKRYTCKRILPQIIGSEMLT